MCIRDSSRAVVPEFAAASEEDWGKEYLDYILSCKIVDSVDEAIRHINRYNTGHSETIVTESYENAQRFLDQVDEMCIRDRVKSRTGRVRRGAFFSIFGRTFYFLMPAYGDASWEFFMEERQLRLFEDFCLPVYGGLVTALEYVPYERAYTKEEVSAEKDRYMEEYMEKLQEKGIQILANDGKIEKGESGWKIQGTVTVIEDIAGPVPIPEKHEENQTVNEFN